MTIDAVLPDAATDVVTPYTPTTHQSIIFYGNDRIKMQKEGMNRFELQPSVVVIGPQYTRVNLMVAKSLNAVRIDFHPAGLYRLFSAFVGVARRPAVVVSFDQQKRRNEQLEVLI